MKLKILILFLIILNLANVTALLNPTFEPCSETYYQKLWETILKEPYGPVKPSIYHEGPDVDGKCSNFDLNLTKSFNGYKEVFFVWETITNDEKKILAGSFQIPDPENKWQLPGDFVDRYYTYLFSYINSKDREVVLVSEEDANTEYNTYANGLTDINQWVIPSGLSGFFTYQEESIYSSVDKKESIEINKRQKYLSYQYSESIPVVTNTSSTSGLACITGQSKPCGLPGICSLGVQTCVNNEWSTCSIGPRKEICGNGLDDDCDGVIDNGCFCKEGAVRSCGVGIGICSKGNQTCVNGTWSACQNVILPRPEICDNLLDDDCNGLVDCADPACFSSPYCKQIPVINLCNNNGVKDANETGVDCGGPNCPPCPSCTDGILNQGETRVNVIIDSTGNRSDCGGPNCPPCPTCSDNIKNQDEEGIDCGGSCPNKCPSGGSANNANSKSICGDGFCDETYGENQDTCPQDCGSTPVFPIIVIFFIFIPIVGLLLYFLIKKQNKTKKQQQQQVFKIHSSFLKPQYKGTKSDRLTEELKKIK